MIQRIEAIPSKFPKAIKPFMDFEDSFIYQRAFALAAIGSETPFRLHKV